MTITVQNLNLSKGRQPILKDINARFASGTLTSIIGVNGSGKSMLVKALVGLENYQGEVKLADDKVAYIPQSTVSDQYFSVFEFVLMGLYGSLSWQVSDQQVDQVNQVLVDLKLSHLADRKFGALSGGQQQLVVLAQALVGQPTVLIADEPTSALDLNKQLEYLNVVQNYVHQHDIVGIMVIHDLTLAARFSDQIYLMDQGQLTTTGTPDEVLQVEALQNLYGVGLEIMTTRDGHLAVIPLQVQAGLNQ
ncbi:ABC transporter ATP-binding protein [Lactobacillaceae bacterium L1_55_11]|nr:ABC transporter ATP-binding protein [Lactobacillaceae bacterium L1_55_11]